MDALHYVCVDASSYYPDHWKTFYILYKNTDALQYVWTDAFWVHNVVRTAYDTHHRSIDSPQTAGLHVHSEQSHIQPSARYLPPLSCLWHPQLLHRWPHCRHEMMLHTSHSVIQVRLAHSSHFQASSGDTLVTEGPCPLLTPSAHSDHKWMTGMIHQLAQVQSWRTPHHAPHFLSL